MRRYVKYSTPEPETLLSRLANVHPAGQGRWLACCPAHPDRTPSLSIRAVDGKVLLYCFAGCSPDAILSAVGLSWRDLYSGGSKPWLAPGYYRSTPTPERPTTPFEAREKWQKWWDRATPNHPLLRVYLRARGLSITPPPTLRLATWEGKHFMLARVLDARGELCGMHITELLPDGSGRVSKRLAKGTHPLGGSIRLYPFEGSTPLALAEGIETGLAVHQATGWPVWACVSAIGLERVQLPAEALEVVIAADHDKAGLEAANALARRLLGENRRVRLATPPQAGTDWLDMVAGGVA
ncbi:toprim domain-containing protein [Meiothermus cerbereus]|uniref:toprim domain-containing protein n=1 Tax=Meiothermus cerbereus TaxID=65552 RepID=UPI000A069DA6|nr:toprim domain-containing protein [Meiothermus cerbereus]